MHDTNIVSLNFMRVGDCCLTPKWDFLKYLSWREQVGTTGATSGAGTA